MEVIPNLVMTNRASHGIDGPNRNRWFTVLKKNVIDDYVMIPSGNLLRGYGKIHHF